MKDKINMVYHLNEYVVEGIDEFLFPDLQTFVCTLTPTPHMVETRTCFVSDRKQGVFIYCPEHHDFFDVEYTGKVPIEKGIQ